MKMRLTLLLMVVAITSPQAFRLIGKTGTPPAAGGPDPGVFLTEDFDNPGYENSWTLGADSNGVITDSNTVQKLSGAYSWFLDGSANSGNPNTWSYYDHGAGDFPDVVFGRFYVYMDDVTPAFHTHRFYGSDHTAYRASMAFEFEPGKDAGSAAIRVTVTGGSLESVALSHDEWHYIDFKYDKPAGTLDWRLDGTNQTQATGTTNLVFRYVHMANAGLSEGHYDAIAFSTNDWIGAL